MDSSNVSAAATRTAGADLSYNGIDQRTPPTQRLRDQSLIMSVHADMKLTPNQKLMVALLRCCNFFNGCTHNGWNHVNNVYYVIFLGWTPLKASWVWLVRDIVRFCTTAVAGGHIDTTKHKKWILVAVGIQKIIGGIIMVTSIDHRAHMFKGATDGLAQAYTETTIAAMTLGVVGKSRFHKKALAYNEMIKSTGVMLGIVTFGFASYAVYPNIRNVFYQYILVGIALLLSIVFMPSEDPETIDHNIARGYDSVILTTITRISEYLEIPFPEDDDDGKDDGDFELNNVEDKSSIQAGAESSRQEQPPQEGRDMTFKEMYHDPSRGRSLILLSFVVCFFHLTHATLLPLIGQFVGLETEKRQSLPTFMIIFLSKTFVETACQGYLVGGKIDRWGYRNCMIAACVLLGLNCGLLAIVSSMTKKVWILAIVQSMQGLPNALHTLTIRLYVHLLSLKTGRYNLNFGIMETFKVIGSGTSIMLGGALATAVSYQVAFTVLTSFCVVPVILMLGVDDVTLTNNLLPQEERDDERISSST